MIIGAGLVGSLTAWILSRRGQRGVMVERSADAGGVNGSFSDRFGNHFDYGRHVVHYDRSDFTTRLVEEVLDGRLRRFDLDRGIVVRGHVIPYAADVQAWPEALRRHITLDPAARVKLGDGREAFARAYGAWFADVAFDEMMGAYPTLMWQRRQGIPEEQLMRWLFPWFFPRSEVEERPRPGSESGIYSEESRSYHYDHRHSNPPREPVMYPAEGGFGRFVETMLEDSGANFQIHLGAADIQVDIDPDTLQVHGVTTGGIRYTAERVFWCAPLPVLCKYLGWQMPAGEPQWELLGSFTFAEPVRSDYHEILFADPQHPIRRVNFPGLIVGNDHSHTLQVEYTTLGEDATLAQDRWRDRWLDSLRQLGIIGPDAGPVDFDFKKVSRGIVSTADLGGFLSECEQRIARVDNNLVTPHLAVASDNNARLIPKIYCNVEEALAG